LDNSWVRLEYDVVAGKTDKYGRTLAYVFLLDGTSYNEFMIRKGFAHEYDYDGQKYEYRAAFRAAQAEAKHEQLGLWSPSTCNGDTTRPAVNS
jgi:micrococcal nuclease